MPDENDAAWANALLYPGEAVLWTGQPGKGRLFRKEDVFLIPFSIFWCGFAVFWVVGARRGGAPVYFWISGVPMVFVGLYITVGRFIVKYMRNQKTRYALTDRRIIEKKGKTCKTLDLDRLPPVTVTVRGDGSGDIRFGENAWARFGYGFDLGFGRAGNENALMELRNIPDVNGVKYRITAAADRLKPKA